MTRETPVSSRKRNPGFFPAREEAFVGEKTESPVILSRSSPLGKTFAAPRPSRDHADPEPNSFSGPLRDRAPAWVGGEIPPLSSGDPNFSKQSLPPEKTRIFVNIVLSSPKDMGSHIYTCRFAKSLSLASVLARGFLSPSAVLWNLDSVENPPRPRRGGRLNTYMD